MNPGILIVLIVVCLAVLVWIGLQVKPPPFKPYTLQPPPVELVEIPAGLPKPVETFYRTVYGDRIPVIHTAVISGRARLRFKGVTFPSRFRFTHIAGQDYRHYIEACFFGRPVLKVNEHFIAGKSTLRLPFGVVENEPKVDQAANLGLWGETLWYPAYLLTDGRPRWEAIDANSAWLYVPFGDSEEQFTVHFDVQTGLIERTKAMRWKEASDPAKTGWKMEAIEWRLLEEALTLALSSLAWEDEGSPWAYFELEELVFNAEVADYVRAQGI